MKRVIRLITWGGIGDVILATPAIAAIKQRHPRSRLVVYCNRRTHFEVLLGNPNIDRLRMVRPLRFMAILAALRRWFVGQRELSMSYGSMSPNTLNHLHASVLIGRMLGVELKGQRCELFLTERERQWAGAQLAGHANPVVLHASTHFAVDSRNWQAYKWASVVHELPQCTFIQVGKASEPPVFGALDFRGKTTLRQAFALISQAKLLVGIDSAMAHAATALRIPAVVLFGPSSVVAFGHPSNQNVHRKLRCAPCFDEIFSAPCPYGVECMRAIQVSEVVHAIRRQLATSGSDTMKHDMVEVMEPSEVCEDRASAVEQRYLKLTQMLNTHLEKLATNPKCAEFASRGTRWSRYLAFLRKEQAVYRALLEELRAL